jgi:hypothetical protein
MTRPRKLEDADKAKILDRVRKGEYLMQIARGTGFNTSIIRATAQRAGLVIQRCSDQVAIDNMKRGRATQKAKPAVVRVSPVMSLRDHYTGLKYSLRW